MLEIRCSGTPGEIGLQHGRAAREKIRHGLSFYKEYFLEKASLEWPQATAAALKFMPLLDTDWPDFVAEMKGVAEGAGLAFEDILAMNCRSEISMGMMTDGCTSLSWTSNSSSILAQNWDWDIRQQHSLVSLTIHPTNGNPSITQITEAGLIGKIGFNSSGVGICLNAIRARGVDFSKLPVHLALRTALNCTSAPQALSILQKVGVASASHILIADVHGGTSTEWSAVGLRIIPAKDGILAHANHWLVQQPESAEKAAVLDDSPERMKRMTELLEGEKRCGKGDTLNIETAERFLNDEQGYPYSINRNALEEKDLVTLFSIVMDLRRMVASVRLGRPTEGGEKLKLELTAGKRRPATVAR